MSLDPSEDHGPTPEELEDEDERRTGVPDRRHYTPRERVWLWFGRGGGYRDLWMVVITGLVLFAVKANSDRVDDNKAALGAIQANRVDQTRSACAKTNEVIDSVNGLASALERLVISGAALPGDQPSPGSDPVKWKTLKPGPLSLQLEHQFPTLPTAQKRLDQAQANATKIEDAKAAGRDCEAEVRAIAKAAAVASRTPSPSPSPRSRPPARTPQP